MSVSGSTRQSGADTVIQSAPTTRKEQSATGTSAGEHNRGTVSLAENWYHGTLVRMLDTSRIEVERVQTGVRIEKRILKVLKAFAEYHDMTLGDVLEGIVLHAFDGKTPFSAASLERIRELKKFYDLDLDSSASHRLKEIKSGRKRGK